MILTWFILAILVGVYASNKGKSFLGYFFIAVLLSPLVGFLIVFVSKDLTVSSESSNTYQLPDDEIKTRSKPKYYEFYKKGVVNNYIDNPKNIGKDYTSLANLNIENEVIGRIAVTDKKSGKLLGTFINKRLCNNIKDDDYTHSTIHTQTTCSKNCTCHYCYNGKTEPYSIQVNTLVKVTEEEINNIENLENDITQKNRRRLNDYLRKIGLFDEAKKSRKKIKLNNVNSLADDLTKLGELKEKGLLTEEEFNEQKKKLLKQ